MSLNFYRRYTSSHVTCPYIGAYISACSMESLQFGGFRVWSQVIFVVESLSNLYISPQCRHFTVVTPHFYTFSFTRLEATLKGCLRQCHTPGQVVSLGPCFIDWPPPRWWRITLCMSLSISPTVPTTIGSRYPSWVFNFISYIIRFTQMRLSISEIKNVSLSFFFF